MLRSLSSLCLPNLCLFALASTAQAAPPRCLAGQYDGGQPEMAARLLLSGEGRFRYMMSYGALDEQAQGRWDSDGTKVFLTSDPVNPPRFALLGEAPAEAGQFRVRLSLPDGISPQYFNGLIVLKDGRTIGSPLGYNDWVVDLKPGEEVASVKFQLPVLDIESERFVVTAGTASEARFSFAPNDLGQVAFAQEPLKIDGRDLVLERHERSVHFRPERGGC